VPSEPVKPASPSIARPRGVSSIASGEDGDYPPRLVSGVRKVMPMLGFVRRFDLKGMRGFAWAGTLLLLALFAARPAGAAPEVHRLSLVLSANPTQLIAADLNDFIDTYNRTKLEPKGLEALGNVSFAWYNQAEVRYFVRPNWAMSAGVGQIRSETRREFLPRISQIITLRTDVVSVPVHGGAAYYLAPFTQGDFQARAYVGGGFMSLTNNKIVFEQLEFQTDSATTLGGSQRSKSRGDGPGYYFELGGHMFFASRYSVMIGAIYRSAIARRMHVLHEVVVPGGTATATVVQDPNPGISLDTGGLGLRMGLAIGF
jgi:hypothetical protein